ncbi:MAG: helix-turn-helix transcriptional regulator [Myxococcales bacterium]|nr:helix-turn-helix transcriptional regulator [Myxococcales bacterium]
MTGSRVTTVIDAAYDAAFGVASWADVAESLRDLSGAVAAGFSLRPTQADGAFQQHWAGLDPGFERLYVEELYQEDPWVEGAARMPIGRTWCGNQFIDDADLVQTRFYNEACAPFGYRDIAGCILAVTPSHTITFGAFVERPAELERFHLVDQVLPHLARALAIGPGGPKRLPPDVTAMLAALNMPAAVVDADACLVQANGPGHALLLRGEGVRLEGRRLRCGRAGVERALHADIAQAAQGRSERPPPIGVPRPRRQRALAVSVLPVPMHLAGQRLALVVFIDPDAPTSRGAAAVARVFDLSPAEARLTAALGQGLELREISESLGLSIHTVRTQMRAVFRKTGCSRQAELTALVARLAPLDVEEG